MKIKDAKAARGAVGVLWNEKEEDGRRHGWRGCAEEGNLV